jgi:hypothetical protein
MEEAKGESSGCGGLQNLFQETSDRIAALILHEGQHNRNEFSEAKIP